MNIKKMKLVAVLLIILFVLSTLAGCGNSSRNIAEANTNTVQEATVIIGGRAANTATPDYKSSVLLDAVGSTTRNFGYVSVIKIGGEPSKAFDENFDIADTYKKAPAEKLESDAKVRADKFMDKLSEVYADTSELDYLKALHLAVRELNSFPDDTRKQIIVIGSGLSTTGTLDFRNNLLMALPDEIVSVLEEREAVPNLSGVTVVWQQMGDTVLPQEELSYQQRNRLMEIWEAIIKAGGGELIISDSIPETLDDLNALPSVSVVELPADPVIEIINENSNSSEIIKIEQPTFFNIEFIADSNEYINVDRAINILTPVAKYMKQENDFKLLVIGTTAGDEDSNYVQRLSLDRAYAVKRTLIELGVDEDRIEILGMGNHDPWHIYDVGVDGPLAEQNRKVVMLPLDSEDAKEILGF